MRAKTHNALSDLQQPRDIYVNGLISLIYYHCPVVSITKYVVWCYQNGVHVSFDWLRTNWRLRLRDSTESKNKLTNVIILLLKE